MTTKKAAPAKKAAAPKKVAAAKKATPRKRTSGSAKPLVEALIGVIDDGDTTVAEAADRMDQAGLVLDATVTPKPTFPETPEPSTEATTPRDHEVLYSGPQRMLAVDPGAVHCGMALFVGDRCVDAYERPPAECLLLVREWMEQDALDVLLVEDFQLYRDKTDQQVGSRMETVRVIGALEFIHAWWGTNKVELKEYPASIQKPTLAILKAKKVPSTAKRLGAGTHAKSAELHGWHHLLQQKQQMERATARKA